MPKVRPETVVTDFADLRSLSPRRYGLRAVRYMKGAETIAEDAPGSFGSIGAAMREADRLQGMADERCEPVTVFVVDDAGIAIRRAGDRP